MNVKALVSYTKELLEQHKDAEKSMGMAKYMKDLFPYYGIKSPERKELVGRIKKEVGINDIDEIVTFAKSLWKEPQRELQYIGMDLLIAKAKKLKMEHMADMEELVTTKSWWDSVDGIASNCLGAILKDDEAARKAYASKWIESDNMWLQRSSIIFQLKYKDDVDEEILFGNIVKMMDSKEFFIQKASGWALRQYSKFNKASVKAFIDGHPGLAKLTIKEGSKYL